MKKHLFYLALGSLALTACTSEDIPDVDPVQSNVIGFENVINKPTRAVDGNLDNTNFKNFLVYGYYTKGESTTPVQIFNGVPVHKVITKNEEGKDVIKWEYDGTRYWIPDCKYFFYAYSCGDIALASSEVGIPAFSLFDATNTSVDNRALTLKQYLCDESHQHDLVTAENENVKSKVSGNDQVSLSFSHALCKVKALFTTDFPDGYKVYVSNVFVSSFYNRADFNVGTGVWNNYTGKTSDPTVFLPLAAESYVENKADSKVETGDVFIIPKLYDIATNENTRIHFTINVVKVGQPAVTDEEGKVIQPAVPDVSILTRTIVGTWSPQWKSGNIYLYRILISGSTAGIEPIVFAAEQSLNGSDSWDNSTQLNMTFGVDANPTPASAED